MKKYNSKLAFSLIELSVVILIIGILVIGITKGARIIRASKLRSAQTLTTGSPVSSMDNLSLWVEASLDKSFVTGEATDTTFASNGTITTWNDINPQSTTPNSPTQATPANKPRYRLNSINGLPALNFDGTSDFFTYDGTFLANSNYTIFILEQRRAGGSQMFLGGTGGTTNANLGLGYRSGNNPTFDNFSNSNEYSIADFNNTLIPRIHTYRFSTTFGKNFYINSVFQTVSTTGGCCINDHTALITYTGANIGKINNGSIDTFYTGDIGEIIIFKKYLSDTERTNVEKYLKAKWGIK